jgi:hypothetical protein
MQNTQKNMQFSHPFRISARIRRIPKNKYAKSGNKKNTQNTHSTLPHEIRGMGRIPKKDRSQSLLKHTIMIFAAGLRA